MENMLTSEDLKAIGILVGEQIDERVPKIIKELVPPMIAEGIDALEERMDVKFDAVHEDIESIRNQMVTKDYLDRKLTEYVRKPQ
jgi:hypothetical protein